VHGRKPEKHAPGHCGRPDAKCNILVSAKHQTSRAHRNPALPVELSGVFAVRAATR